MAAQTAGPLYEQSAWIVCLIRNTHTSEIGHFLLLSMSDYGALWEWVITKGAQLGHGNLQHFFDSTVGNDSVT